MPVIPIIILPTLTMKRQINVMPMFLISLPKARCRYMFCFRMIPNTNVHSISIDLRNKTMIDVLLKFSMVHIFCLITACGQ